MTTQSSALSPQHSILVTGGAGFIGSNFVHYWIKNYPEDRVVILDALTYAGNPANLEPVAKHPHYRFVQGDIRDYDLAVDLLQEEKIDTIVHFAAESHVDRSIHGPDAFVDTNIIGTHTLLKAAKKVWLDQTNEEIEVKSERIHLSTQSSVLSPLAINFIMFQPMKCTVLWGLMTRPFLRPPLTRLIHPMLPARPVLTIWYAPISRHTACQ